MCVTAQTTTCRVLAGTPQEGLDSLCFKTNSFRGGMEGVQKGRGEERGGAGSEEQRGHGDDDDDDDDDNDGDDGC